ncbi:28 kDa heat- and acid-stable phosphoprotein-like [Anneissia japonica]|uniref:28 kDa heat- and acid-stable phosphoprotein-like n=1 Tax=Anneissia japonica TaxID=1529436 RepID=UPI0014257116|nr:28 kDa heat- and acid-stable phosphoprotein-like [Anneissia japonica]
MPKGRGGKVKHKGRGRTFHNPDEIDAQMKDNTDAWRQKNRDMPPSSSSEEESSDEEDRPTKGIEGLIEIENPNRVANKMKKASNLNVETATSGTQNLSRREREEIEKQQAHQRYLKLHAEGKTDEARADLARLQIIRKQREDAAKKRDQEKKAKEDAAKAKAKKK